MDSPLFQDLRVGIIQWPNPWPSANWLTCPDIRKMNLFGWSGIHVCVTVFKGITGFTIRAARRNSRLWYSTVSLSLCCREAGVLLSAGRSRDKVGGYTVIQLWDTWMPKGQFSPLLWQIPRRLKWETLHTQGPLHGVLVTHTQCIRCTCKRSE